MGVLWEFADGASGIIYMYILHENISCKCASTPIFLLVAQWDGGDGGG